MEPVILASARRHDIADKDMLHAHRNHISADVQDDGVIMFVGADLSGRLLEVATVWSDGYELIIHAMPVQPKNLR